MDLLNSELSNSNSCRVQHCHMLLFKLFTARRYACALYAVVVCLSVCHTPVLYHNG